MKESGSESTLLKMNSMKTASLKKSLKWKKKKSENSKTNRKSTESTTKRILLKWDPSRHKETASPQAETFPLKTLTSTVELDNFNNFYNSNITTWL